MRKVQELNTQLDADKFYFEGHENSFFNPDGAINPSLAPWPKELLEKMGIIEIQDTSLEKKEAPFQ